MGTAKIEVIDSETDVRQSSMASNDRMGMITVNYITSGVCLGNACNEL